MRPIHIALTFTDSYWALAFAAMRSACLSTRNRQQLVFHLCHSGLTAAHRAILDEIASEFGASLRHYDPEQEPAFTAALEHLPVRGKFPAIVYARLFLDRLLPAEVERVLYLDCDTMVRRHLDVLYDTDLAGKALAAVADPYHDGIKLGRDIRDKKSPFDAADPYFNSGVLLIDRAALAAADLPGRIADMQKLGLLDQLYFDQDILNYVFAGNWLELDWRFNLMIPRKPHEGLNPAILHYTGYRHPWEIWSGVAFSRTYRHVMTNRVFWQFWRERQKRRLLGRA
jgi:lipopolysaccharide biosynthesis glycosyltransferase